MRTDYFLGGDFSIERKLRARINSLTSLSGKGDQYKRGIRVVGISVDPPEASHRQSQKLGYTFPLLSDPNAQVIRRYDVLHAGAGPKGADIARPAEFLLDENGIVRWVNLTENIAVRARPEQVLAAFDEMKAAGQ